MNILNLEAGTADVTSNEIHVGDMSPEQLCKYLQQTLRRLKGESIHPEGYSVNYFQMEYSTTFKELTRVAHLLTECDPSLLSLSERKAFFINLYNCLILHAIVMAKQLPASVLELDEFWKQNAYSVNGMVFSLDDIEHGILRGNKPHPSSDKPQFENSDPRKVMTMECDPRVHFALNCGARSCPAIRVYTGKNLETALTTSAELFCAQEVGVNERNILLSKLFQWYATDFGSNEREVLRYLCQYVTKETKSGIEQLLSSTEPINMRYKEYDWRLNKL